MPRPSWTPNPESVHALIPARVQDRPFSEDTVPTVGQVLEVVDQVTVEVLAEVGRFEPAWSLSGPVGSHPNLGDLAARVVALGAASQIEDSFFPEQQQGTYVGVDSTPSQHLYARYRRALEQLKAAVGRSTGHGVEFTGSVSTPLTTVTETHRQPDVPYPHHLR